MKKILLYDDNPPVPKGRGGKDREGEEHVMRMVQSQNLKQLIRTQVRRKS
jgi:hypothetical protein